ncbi:MULTISPECIES: hypothetical protein [unclassified Roseateles]|uniref:hypothetical protein n=1 Tax=Pelomonas sp. Root1237 TaxID=1736434 RepID=UPI0006FC43C5|nr:hypothetical protein [Pelomonas sp. Root1237]KQV86786.1 hypothetical protein ASC91_19220 [Pelomonas sp. Root1237]
MHYRSDNPSTDWPETMLVGCRSEAFAEDLEHAPAPSPRWNLLERLIMALPLLCVFAPVADAYLIH